MFMTYFIVWLFFQVSVVGVRQEIVAETEDERLCGRGNRCPMQNAREVKVMKTRMVKGKALYSEIRESERQW